MIETRTDKPSVTITLPSWVLAVLKLVDYAAKTVVNAGEVVGEAVQDAQEKAKSNPIKKIKFPKLNLKGIFEAVKNKFPKSKKAIISSLVVLVVVFAVFAFIKSNNSSSNQAQVGAETTEGSLGQVSINKKFDVAIKKSDGKLTGGFLHINVTNIEKNNSILISNKPVKTKEGKTFLIINLEIQNDTKDQLSVKPVDMVRLVDNEGKTYAADVYNNDVSAEAVSLKKTRIGYVVDANQKTFKFLIGEVREKQEPIEVSF